jgi:hypothetical protein
MPEPVVIVPARPTGGGPPARRAAMSAAGLVSRGAEAGHDWPGAVPTAGRWCAGCRAGRKRAAARYQVELSVPPFAADLCGTCLARLWREAPQVVLVARLLPPLSQRAAQPGQDALLRRLTAAGLRVPGLAGRARP